MRPIVLLAIAAFVALLARADDVAVMNELRGLWFSLDWPVTSFTCDGSWVGVVCDDDDRVQEMYVFHTACNLHF